MTAVTVANSGGASGTPWHDVVVEGASTITYAASPIIHGAVAARVAAAANSRAYLMWNATGLTDLYGRLYLYLTGLPAAGSVLSLLRVTDTAGNTMAGLNISATGTITTVAYNGTVGGGGTGVNGGVPIVTGSPVRVEWHLVLGSAAAGLVEVRLFTSPESTSPAETITATAVNTTGTPSQYRTGSVLGRVVPPPAFYLDDIAWALTDWPGPSGTLPPDPPPPPPPDTTLTYPGAPANWITAGTDVPGGGATVYTLRALSIDAAGYQNTGNFAHLGVGHGWQRLSGADTAGCHTTVDGVQWVTANRGLSETSFRVSCIEGSRTVANRIWMYTTNNNGTNNARLHRGTYDPTSGTVTWTLIETLPFGAQAGLDDHPRQTGRTLALDEPNGVVYVGTISGLYRVSLTGAAAPVRVALAGVEIDGVVLDPDNSQIAYCAAGHRNAATDEGVYRVNNIRTGTPATSRYSAAGAAEDLVLVDTGTDKRVYVAFAGSVRRWIVSADITSGWTNLTNNFIQTGNPIAGVDARRVAGATRILVTTAGNGTSTNAGAYALDDNGASTSWVNENGGWAVSLNVLGYTSDPWWLPDSNSFFALDNSGYDSTSPRINPSDPDDMHLWGRSGTWRRSGGVWRPSVKGMVGDIGWGITCAPTGGGGIGQSGDWGSVDSADQFTTQPDRTLPGGNAATCMGVMYRADNGKVMVAHGDYTANTDGDAFTSTNPHAATPTWTNLGFTGGQRCVGAAIGDNASGTEVYLTLRDGVGIQRKVGGGAPTTVETGITNAFYARARFWWPDSHSNQPIVFLAAPNGLWRSLDYGASWARILTFTNSSEYTGTLRGLPTNKTGTLFLTSTDGPAGPGLYKVTGAAGANPVMTRIGPAVTSAGVGPCAVDAAGHVWFAATANQAGGAKLYRSADPNPGAATSFTDISTARWTAGVTYPSDMDFWANGELAVSAKQAGYFGVTPLGGGTSGGYEGCCNGSSVNTTGGVLHDMGGNAGCNTAGGAPFTPPNTYSQWGLAGTWKRIEWKLRVDLADATEGQFWAMQSPSSGGGLCYAGLLTNAVLVNTPIRIALFSVWDAVGAVAGTAAGAVAVPFSGEGVGWSVRAPYAWATGSVYTLRVQADTARGVGWWRLEVVADATGTVSYIGSIQAPAGWGDLDSAYALAFTEWFTNEGGLTSCLQVPRATAFFGAPGYSAVTVAEGSGTGGGGGGTGTGVAQPLLLALHRPLATPPAAVNPPVIDASSPAAVRSNNTNSVRTSASFTPPAGALLLAVAANNTQAGIERDHTLTDSLGGAWTQRAYVTDLAGTDGPGVRGQVEIWTRNTAATGAAMTVTDTIDGNEGGMLKVLVLTSANVAAPVGDVGAASGLATAAGLTLTTQFDQSLVVGAVSEWNLTAVGTASAGVTVSDGAIGPNITSYLLRRAAIPSAGTAAPLTTTAPTTGTEWNAVAVEIRGT